MYNKSMMYNIPMQGQIPYCPFIRSMYMIPEMMMRSEDSNDELDIPLPDDINDDLSKNTSEDIRDRY